MTEPSGDEEDRMRFIFKRVEVTELDYLLAMLELPDGVARMRAALQNRLDRSDLFRNRGLWKLTPLMRRRREKLFVLLGDVVKLPRKTDVAAAGNRMLGYAPAIGPIEPLARRQVLCRYWMELQRMPAEEQDRRLAGLAAELGD